MPYSITPRYRPDPGRGLHAGHRERPSRAQHLVERDWELDQLKGLMNDARAGMGAAAFVEAPTGMGKSRLLSVAGDMARRADMRVLEACGMELEQQFRFALAIQLFEPIWLDCSPAERAALTSGPARPIRALLDEPECEPLAAPGSDEVIHALFRFTANLVAATQNADRAAPLVLLADDIHHADVASLRFLAYLGARLPELPIAVVMAARSGQRPSDPAALRALRDRTRNRHIEPSPLTPDGVREIVERRFPDSPGMLSAACAHLSGGSPWLLAELLAEWERAELPAVMAIVPKLEQMIPQNVRRLVAAQLASLADPASAVAGAIAVLGDGATVRRVAAITDLDADDVLRTAAAMAAGDLLRPGPPLSFARPLIRAAVSASLSPFERARLHRRAAAILVAEKAGPGAVAAHLLHTPAGSDPDSIAILREAARCAAGAGDAEGAVELLERALAEQSSDEIRGELLADLAEAETSAGSPQASERLREAATLSRHPERRAELLLAQGRALCSEGRYREAAAVLDAGLTGHAAPGDRLFDELTAAYLVAESLAGRPDPLMFERREAMVESLSGDPSVLQRAAIAHTVVHDGLHGASREFVRRLAELAWGDGQLLGVERPDTLSVPLTAAALLFVDELERCIELCDAMLDRIPHEPPGAYAEVRHARAWARFERGSVATARDDAQSALTSLVGERRSASRTGLATIVSCHIEGGQFEQADTVFDLLERHGSQDSIEYPLLLEARARLRLLRHRPDEALADATEAGRALQTICSDASPGVVAWRSTAALAHLALDQPNEARELAEEEMALARTIGLTRIVIRDLRVLGLATGGRAGVDLLAEAVRTGDAHAARLEHIRALIDLGAALRRRNRRSDAREPLRRGLELAHKSGAMVLSARAHTELVAAGARPRRVALTGFEALTASERRVAELAGELSTRQVAQALFITPKTVEFHLRHIYQKLRVNSRAELVEAVRQSQAA
jgi:DNA-binding CsgD family transcriptional regulator